MTKIKLNKDIMKLMSNISVGCKTSDKNKHFKYILFSPETSAIYATDTKQSLKYYVDNLDLLDKDYYMSARFLNFLTSKIAKGTGLSLESDELDSYIAIWDEKYHIGNAEMDVVTAPPYELYEKVIDSAISNADEVILIENPSLISYSLHKLDLFFHDEDIFALTYCINWLWKKEEEDENSTPILELRYSENNPFVITYKVNDKKIIDYVCLAENIKEQELSR